MSQHCCQDPQQLTTPNKVHLTNRAECAPRGFGKHETKTDPQVRGNRYAGAGWPRHARGETATLWLSWACTCDAFLTKNHSEKFKNYAVWPNFGSPKLAPKTVDAEMLRRVGELTPGASAAPFNAGAHRSKRVFCISIPWQVLA